MATSLYKPEPQPNEQITALEKEIAALEQKLTQTENKLHTFSAQLRAHLLPQIKRIQELTLVYKKLKADKKTKRLEQKKKGKNYREPLALKKTNVFPTASEKMKLPDRQELKRLYKEAMKQVHPDKFANEATEKATRATELSAQLNEYYDAGDLEELKGFYEYIISGNALHYVPQNPENLPDAVAMLNFLQKKKAGLKAALEEIENSELYHVLTTYEDPLTFIPELQFQFEQKIRQLEKRTRKANF